MPVDMLQGMERIAAVSDHSLSLQVFMYLQLLDVLTTWVGLRFGLSEASPFVRLLMEVGPLAGLLGSKLVAVALAGYCVWRGRFTVIRWINYWFAALAVWNLTLLTVIS